MPKSSNSPFKVVGVDLAANPKDTALCQIVVTPGEGTATVKALSESDASDDGLLKAFSREGVARIGIDAPFGWPRPFVWALRSHARHNVWPRDTRRGDRHFANLTLRATDVHVAEQVDGVTPLSVSADKIGVVAMRAALLLSRAPSSLKVDRSGFGEHFVEVYPAAALARWFDKKWSKGYKGRKPEHFLKRCHVVRKLLRCFEGLHLDGVVPDHNRRSEIKRESEAPESTVAAPIRTDHDLDALISALVTLMAEADRQLRKHESDPLIEPVPQESQARAKTEGWIALPKPGSLECLGRRLRALKP